ncbi:MAG TPA: MaoC/PaaZ C-terminal domain-containing protein [Jatrophihabitans sp.]|nr:MaoC/PaaZ C-terminal domain-containing protein [Jatrophihabitans sp.]
MAADPAAQGVELLPAAPSLPPLFVKAMLARRHGDALTGRAVRLTGQQIDVQRLWRYQRLCGFRVSDVLPPTYLHLLAFPLSVELMAGSAFPLPLLGLVHISNSIQQLRPVRASEPVAVTVCAQNLRSHPAGRQVELASEVSIDGRTVWREVSTYLHREHASERPVRAAAPPAPAGPVIRWQVPAGIGRAYAAISGDRNPIHLSTLSAKAFGFRAAIAHGMWLEARSLAAFEGRLPAAGRFDVSFKTPVYLPATVQLQAVPAAAGWQFEVHDERSGRPHLAGTISGWTSG